MKTCMNTTVTAGVRSCRHRLPVVMALLALVLVGCASSSKVQKQPPATAVPAEPAVAYDESFDPAPLRAIPFEIPHKASRPPLVQSQVTVPLAADTAAVDTTWVTVPGYQVQLLQTENGSQARETLRIAILDLDADVELVYDPPYYKVRAGRFLNRAEAERLQSIADERGYANSWVVRTSVRVRAHELIEGR